MSDLQDGFLKELRQRLLRDSTLDFQIRDNQVHIYYRGGKVFDLKQRNPHEYEAHFDKNYASESLYQVRLSTKETREHIQNLIELPIRISESNIGEWISAIPFLKQIMDEYFSQYPKLEREYQQHVVNENNRFKTSNGTDYFIVDIEYATATQGRFDLISILWPSTGRLRRVPTGYKPKLAFIEMKWGDSALSNQSGIQKHLNDIEAFLGEAENLESIRTEMQTIFQQKRDLGLLQGLGDNKNKVEISDEKPEFILLFSAHDPESQILLDELNKLKAPKHCDLKIAVANFMGYGLYQECLYGLEDFRKCFSKQLRCNGN